MQGMLGFTLRPGVGLVELKVSIERVEPALVFSLPVLAVVPSSSLVSFSLLIALIDGPG
jgi:hypothetical protein